MPVVEWLLSWSPMPDRSKVITQTKMDNLILQVGVGCETDNRKKVCQETFKDASDGTDK